MNILSLFDGISCARLAMNHANLPVSQYFSSEIDENAIKVAHHNFPDTQQLGDVTQITKSSLPPIDLLIGGSPCQSFSLSGKRRGFDDPRGQLFFQYHRLLKELKPRYFILENVIMKKAYQDVITSYLKVDPIIIDSALLTAQRRLRQYWTNIPVPGYPLHTRQTVNDILDPNHNEKGIAYQILDSTPPVTFSNTISKYTAPNLADMTIFIPFSHLRNDSGLIRLGGVRRPSHKNWCKNNKVYSQGTYVYSPEGKSSTLQASGGGLGRQTGLYLIDGIIRRLSRLECERLQGVPDNYTSCLTTNQAKKSLGNGFTVPVISFIMSFMDGAEAQDYVNVHQKIYAKKMTSFTLF